VLARNAQASAPAVAAVYLSSVPFLYLAIAIVGLPVAATAAGWLEAGLSATRMQLLLLCKANLKPSITT
jgi:hypothetical protein